MAFFKGFKYAARGIWLCIKNERNMRIHTVVAVYVLVFARFFALSKQDFILLLLTFASVMCAEMLNTACERLCDLSCEKYSRLIRCIKDIAAGAVLICALFSVVIGIVLFSDFEGYIRIFNYYIAYPWLLVPLLLSLVLSVLYIVWGPVRLVQRLKPRKRKKQPHSIGGNTHGNK